jgi:two-component system KDP operon response regulator KdpE
MNEARQKKATVLIVEDEVHMRRMLQICLEREGYEIKMAATGEEGISQAIGCKPDIILLDLDLPDMEGIEVLKQLREWTLTPVVAVSVQTREEEKIAVLDKGANDYVTKPFGTGELLARLRVILRYGRLKSMTETFKSGSLEVDLTGRLVKVRGKAVKLTPTEYSILILFVQHAGKLLTHGYLLREIWNSADPGLAATLRVYIRYLREKLEEDPANPELLVTESGVGYRLVVRD